MSETCHDTIKFPESDPLPTDLFKVVSDRCGDALNRHNNNDQFEFVLTSEEDFVPLIKFCLADTFEHFRTNKGEVLEITLPLFLPDSKNPIVDKYSAIPLLDDLNPNRYFTISHHWDKNTREFVVNNRGIKPSREHSLFPRRLRPHKPSSQYATHLRDKIANFELVPLRRRDLPRFEVEGDPEDN
jgi:hypothetical protein